MTRTRRTPSRRPTTVAARAVATCVAGALVAVACGSETVQTRAGDAVAGYIGDHSVLADGDFDTDCVHDAAARLDDEVAQAIVDDDGRIDFDVDRAAADDAYDFYNCADESSLARAIADDSDGAIDERCLEDLFDDIGISNAIEAADHADPSRLGDFRSLEAGDCGADGDDPEPPATTLPPPVSTTTTSTTTTSTTTTTTTTTTPPPTTAADRSMTTPTDYADETEAFLNDDNTVSDAVGSDVNSVQCSEPSHIEVGTNYLCFGQSGDGAIEFSVEINAENSFLVLDFQPAFDDQRILFFRFLVDGLVAENLELDQVCLRDLVAGYSDTDVDLIVTNLSAEALPDGVSFDEDGLANDLIGCVTGP